MITLTKLSQIGAICVLFLLFGHRPILDEEHAFSVDRVVWSSNVSNLAIETSDGIWLYDLTSNSETPQLIASCGEQTSNLVFAHMGLRLAFSTPDNGKMHVRDIQSTEEQLSLDPPGDTITDLAFNTDDTVLAVSTAELERSYGFLQNGAVYLWDVVSGSELSQIGNEFPVAVNLAFDTNNSSLVIAGSSVGRDPNTSFVEIWNTQRLSKGNELPWQPINALPISNGSIAVLSVLNEYDENNVEVWDVRSKMKVREITQPGEITTSLGLSTDGTRLATTTRSGKVFVWNVETGEQLTTPIRNTDTSVRSLAFSPTADRLAFISSAENSEGQVQLYDLDQQVVTTLPSPQWQEQHCS